MKGPAGSRILAGGRLLEYVRSGPGPDEAPTLVFLHDGIGCAATWRDFPRDLAGRTGCGAFAYSRAGYGGSDPVPLPRPLSYLEKEGEDVLPEVLDAAGIRRAVLVGHSDGATISLLHASTPRSSPRVLGLLLEAPHVFCEEITIEGVRQAREEFLRGALRDKLARRHGGNVDCAFFGWNDAWLDPGFRGWNIEDRLPAVSVPVLVAQGQEDPYGTVRQVEAIERGCGGAVLRMILPGCGHVPHRERREEVLSGMAAFVRGLL